MTRNRMKELFRPHNRRPKVLKQIKKVQDNFSGNGVKDCKPVSVGRGQICLSIPLSVGIGASVAGFACIILALRQRF
jgi:hypothetical protein